MEDISNLIREARPLYHARKSRNRRVMTTLGMLVCVIGFSFLYPQGNKYELVSNSEYVLLDSSYYYYEGGSIIEDMGLPTDDYGLLSVV